MVVLDDVQSATGNLVTQQTHTSPVKMTSMVNPRRYPKGLETVGTLEVLSINLYTSTT